MKKLAVLSALVLVAAVANAQDAKETTAAKAAPTMAAADAKTHDVQAEIVSYDAAKQTLTLKGTPDNKIVPVDATAVDAVKNLKAGQKVTLICRDSDLGEHRAVAGVKVNPDKAPAKLDEKK